MSMLAYIASRFWQTVVYSASDLLSLRVSPMWNLLVPLCGRTGGGRVRACWFYMPSLSTPFRSATIINWQWFGRTSNAYRSQSWLFSYPLFAASLFLLISLNLTVHLPCLGNEDHCTPDFNHWDTDLAGSSCHWLFADTAAVLALGGTGWLE